MIDRERLLAWSFADIEHAYSHDDTMRYALALGAGADPCDAAALRFVEDSAAGTPLALPTMAVVIGFPGSWMRDPATGIDFDRIVHGEEELYLHHPIPAQGVVIARHRIVDVIDKGPGKGAIIIYDKDLYLRDDATHLATVRHTTFARGDGGFSGKTPVRAPTSLSMPLPVRTPDRVITVHGMAQQALLYRLCGDRNPLHSDPVTARRAGFDRPILHGLCTFGMAGYAIVLGICDGDPAALASLVARFSSPVYPGETLLVETFREGREVRFQARVRERDVLVLTQGRATLRAEDN